MDLKNCYVVADLPGPGSSHCDCFLKHRSTRMRPSTTMKLLCWYVRSNMIRQTLHQDICISTAFLVILMSDVVRSRLMCRCYWLASSSESGGWRRPMSTPGFHSAHSWRPMYQTRGFSFTKMWTTKMIIKKNSKPWVVVRMTRRLLSNP